MKFSAETKSGQVVSVTVADDETREQAALKAARKLFGRSISMVQRDEPTGIWVAYIRVKPLQGGGYTRVDQFRLRAA